MADEHTSDIRGVREGDSATLETTDGSSFDVECVNRQTQHADPRSGEVTETEIWTFETGGETLYASITDGLKSSPGPSPFPDHSSLYDPDAETGYGYIESIK